jgi:hypothetical protein
VIASESVVNLMDASTEHRCRETQLQGPHPVEDPHAGVVRPASANAEDPGWLLAAAWSQPYPKKRNAGQLRVPLPALMLDAYRLGDSGHLIIWARQNPISKPQDLYVCIAQCAGTQSNSDRLLVETLGMGGIDEQSSSAFCRGSDSDFLNRACLVSVVSQCTWCRFQAAIS